MERIWFFRMFFLFACWRTGTSEVYNGIYGSTLVVKPMPTYEIKHGILIQTLPRYNDCKDSAFKYTWNGSHFLIGPALTSYTGEYVMRLQNNSNIWENRSLSIIIKTMPHVKSRNVIIDQGDSINLTCTYRSNCKLEVMWTKSIDNPNSLRPTEEKILANNTKSLMYILIDAEKYFAGRYSCLLGLPPPLLSSTNLNLEVKDWMDLNVEKSNVSKWFEENQNATIQFSIFGSPLPSLTCVDGRKGKIVIFCSKKQMNEIIYAEESKPCISKNGRYTLSSQNPQTEKVKFSISKVNLERDNGVITCHLKNSRDQQQMLLLAVNIKVLSDVKIAIKNEQNRSFIHCVVRSNPPPEFSWEKCGIDNTTRCEPIKKMFVAKKRVGNQSHTYMSSILLDTTHDHITHCIAKNSFWSRKIPYVYRSVGDNNEVPTVDHKSNKNNMFIAIGCVLLLLSFVVVTSLVLYVRERTRKRTYKRFFLEGNNYTIDPMKTLNEQMHDLSYDEDWEFPYMYLKFNELIGCGAFGKVYKAKAYGICLMNSRDKSTQAKKQRKQLNKARNKMKLAHYKENECMTVAVKTTKDNPKINDIRNLAGELKMIIHIGQHENIVNVLGACTKYPKLYMIIEYCSNGSLLEFVRKRREIFQPSWFKEDFASKERLTFANLVSAAIQICNGMKFLASKKCIHRDLAARNVLVSDSYVMKVADFGLAREVFDSDNYVSNTQAYLPIKWMALESLLEKVYTEESDVWSFGILLWEMFTLGQTPYPSIPVQQLVALLKDCLRMEKPDHCPTEIYLTMLECWNENPKNRPTFELLFAKLRELLQANIIENSRIDMDNNWDKDKVVCTETDILHC